VRPAVPLVVACLGVGLGCPPSTEDCGGFCGPGTVCTEGRCVVQPEPEPEAEPEPESDAKAGNKRRRRRGRRGGGGGDEDPPAAGGLDDRDGHIPRYRSDREEVLGEGGERPSDRSIRQQLSRLEPAFDRCLARAAAVTDTALSGTVTFQIGIEPSGKVWGVNARLPPAWDVPGLRACFRIVVFDHRFDGWSGPSMSVDYHFQVE